MSPSRYFVAGLIACLLIVVLLGTAWSAFAQPLCGPADRVEASLIKGGNKLAVDLKLKAEGPPIRMRIFANPTSKRWVMLSYQDADNIACLVMIGEGFEPARLPGSDA
jgi:hypothetical protein